MVIQHNLSAINTHRQMGINNRFANKNLEKLSSGFKINRAADNAAGLAISEKMRGQIRGTMMGTQNVNMGINLVQTAEGALNETHSILGRMRELAVQSSNGTYHDKVDRENLEKEYQALKSEVDRIADSTHYNGIKVLNVPQEGIATITETRYEAVYKTEVIPSADAIMNQIQASLMDPPVNADGKFRFFAQNNNGNSMQLLYGGAYPSTSYPSIRVNGEIHRFQGNNSLTLDQATVHDNGVWSTTFGLRNGDLDLKVIQNVSIVDNPPSMGGQSYKIDYEVINNNPTVPVTIDLMYHVDTQLGQNDHAPFEVEGQAITNNTSYPRDGSIPGEISIYDSLNNPYIYGVITVNDTTGFSFAANSAPDRLNLAHYSTANTYNNLPNGNVGDSGYSLIWENRTIADQPSVMTTYYGVMNPPPDVIAAMGPTVEMKVFDGYREVTETRQEGIEPELWIQSGANSKDGMYIKLCDARSSALDIDKTSIASLDFANDAIDFVDSAVNTVSSYRADFGASQNRLESTLNNNGVKTENLQSAESTIRDVDMAKEMMEFTKNNILAQAAQSMLAQANQLPQGVLSLLR